MTKKKETTKKLGSRCLLHVKSMCRLRYSKLHRHPSWMLLDLRVKAKWPKMATTTLFSLMSPRICKFLLPLRASKSWKKALRPILPTAPRFWDRTIWFSLQSQHQPWPRAREETQK